MYSSCQLLREGLHKLRLNATWYETKAEIKPKPFKIICFKINGSEEPNVESLCGNAGLSGSKQLTVNQALPQQIQLLVTDKFGNKATTGFSVKVKASAPSQSSSSQPLF